MPKQKPNKGNNLLTKSNETLTAIITSSTITEAAKKLGISRRSLYERIDRYELRPQIELVRQQAQDNLVIASLKASDNLVTKIDHHNPSISMDASKEILDRVGVVKPSNTTNNVQVNVQPILEINPNVRKDDSDREVIEA